MMIEYCAFDVEVGPNYFLIGCMDISTNKIWQFHIDDRKKFKQFMKKVKYWVGFNSIAYDNPVIGTWLNKRDPYTTSIELIDGDWKWWEYDTPISKWSHIDLMNVAPGSAGLKLYGARLNAPRIQELPVDPHEQLSSKKYKKLCKYNKLDLEVTALLFSKLKGEIDLRHAMSEQYNIPLLGKSDPQIAEAVIASELEVSKSKIKIPSINRIQYTPPPSIKFKSSGLNDIVAKLKNTKIAVGKGGSPIMPEWLKEKVITIGNTTYNIGLGGLHSTEKSKHFKGPLQNVDVASYYPSLIIELGLYPKQLGVKFIDVYRNIYKTRLKAKARGDKVVSDSLKIVLNGLYGKYGSRYSLVYAPDLMLTVTLTGQLYLLMLIEMLERKGVRVVSANTDGIEVIKNPKVKKIVKKWEKRTKMMMEFGEYSNLYARDVNNYVAVYSDHVKAKGVYGEPTLSKNPEYPIVYEAVRKFLYNRTPIESTIRECTDVSKFCVVRTVRGGALWSGNDIPDSPEIIECRKRMVDAYGIGWNGDCGNKAMEKRNFDYKKQFYNKHDDYLGKVVRYYYSKNGAPMVYATSKNLVPQTNNYNGSKPLMTLPKRLPGDVDYDAYIALAFKNLELLGYV